MVCLCKFHLSPPFWLLPSLVKALNRDFMPALLHCGHLNKTEEEYPYAFIPTTQSNVR